MGKNSAAALLKAALDALCGPPGAMCLFRKITWTACQCNLQCRRCAIRPLRSDNEEMKAGVARLRPCRTRAVGPLNPGHGGPMRSGGHWHTPTGGTDTKRLTATASSKSSSSAASRPSHDWSKFT